MSRDGGRRVYDLFRELDVLMGGGSHGLADPAYRLPPPEYTGADEGTDGAPAHRSSVAAELSLPRYSSRVGSGGAASTATGSSSRCGAGPAPWSRSDVDCGRTPSSRGVSSERTRISTAASLSSVRIGSAALGTDVCPVDSPPRSEARSARSSPPPSRQRDADDELLSIADDGPPPELHRTNSRLAGRLHAATALDSALSFRQLEEERRERERQREARRAQRTAAKAAPPTTTQHDDEGGPHTRHNNASAEAATAEAPASDENAPAALSGEVTVLALCAPPTLDAATETALLHDEREGRQLATTAEAQALRRLAADMAASATEASILEESRRRTERRRLETALAGDDTRERERRRIYEVVRDCLMDETYARPLLEQQEAAARDAILRAMASEAASPIFQLCDEERAEREALAEEALCHVWAVAESEVEVCEAVARTALQRQWYRAVAPAWLELSHALSRFTLECVATDGCAEVREAEAVRRHAIRALFGETIGPIVDRGLWACIVAEAEERLQIEREAPPLFDALVACPDNDVPFERSRPLVMWYTARVSQARREWRDYLSDKLRALYEEEMRQRLGEHREQREGWILIEEMHRRDAELARAAAERRKKALVDTAIAEALALAAAPPPPAPITTMETGMPGDGPKKATATKATRKATNPPPPAGTAAKKATPATMAKRRNA